MFHLTNKHELLTGTIAVIPLGMDGDWFCMRAGDKGQGLVMGVDSKNILKCVKHLVAFIKIIWLVLLLDWDLDLWFFCWNSFLAKDFHWDGSYLVCSRSHAGSGQQQWLELTPEHLEPTENPTLLCASGWISRIWDLGNGVLPLHSSKSQPIEWKGQRLERATVLLHLWSINSGDITFLSLLSPHTDCIIRVWSGPCPAQEQQECVLPVGKQGFLPLTSEE